MWLFTIYGFFSVVFKDGKVNIRTRVKGDLETLLTLWPNHGGDIRARGTPPKILTTPDNDYPYRILVDEFAWEYIAEKLAESVMDVENFKDEVTKRQGKARHDVYLDVWRILARAFGTGWSLSKRTRRGSRK